MSDNRSNGSHSPFRPTRLSPPGYDPLAEYDRDPAEPSAKQPEDRSEPGNSVLIFGSAIWILAVVAVQFI